MDKQDEIIKYLKELKRLAMWMPFSCLLGYSIGKIIFTEIFS